MANDLPRHAFVLVIRILRVGVMLESPSYIPTTPWEVDKPREELSDTGSKDALVGMSRLPLWPIRKRPAQ